MSTPKVSVIIPVYNVEPHIERCARSLFEQTLEEIEYIFVNDCTPDASMRILQNVLENYAQRKNQIIIINQPYNMGAAKAREIGIKAASGEYIIHCDSLFILILCKFLAGENIGVGRIFLFLYNLAVIYLVYKILCKLVSVAYCG